MVFGFTVTLRAPLQFSAIECVKSMRHKARDSGGKFALLLLLATILFIIRLETGHEFVRHRKRKIPDSPVHTLSDSLRIYFFPLWRADFKIYGFAVEFARCVCAAYGSRIRKEVESQLGKSFKVSG